MSGIKKNIKWLSIFVMFLWVVMIIFSCQLNNYTEEIENFMETRKSLQIQSIKMMNQSKLINYELTEIKEKLASIEEYLYWGLDYPSGK